MARGDVLLVSLPASEGREQSGRRPAVAVQTDIAGEPMLMIAPITSSLAALRFAFSLRVEPSTESGFRVYKAKLTPIEGGTRTTTKLCK